MNPDTGAIAAFENEEDAKKAGFTIPLGDKLAEELLKIDRDQRLSALQKYEEKGLAIEAAFDRMAKEEVEKLKQRVEEIEKEKSDD